MDRDKLIRLRMEIEEHAKLPIWNIKRQIDALGYSLYVFKTNYCEMVQRTTLSMNDSITIHSEDNQEQFTRAIQEVTRFFHNFLASAKTLVDHARKTVNRIYAKHEFLAEYNAKTSETFALNHLHLFIKDLSNYAQHYALPIVGSNMSFHRDKGFNHAWTLNTDNFSPNYNWSAGAKQFMQGLPDPQLNLHTLASDYYTLVNTFYGWLGDRIQDLHGKEISEAVNRHNSLRAQMMAPFANLK